MEDAYLKGIRERNAPDMIEPSPELAESAARDARIYCASYYANIPAYEALLRGRVEANRMAGFDSTQHYRDVVYLLNLLDRERR